ncbi:hypothetical protein L211DRAFT_279841 [Terfezia boudieri ATCC MYA-4762]|uniref:Uncharacterized protein n=1 Tax=Terfezia boudieri ATCC MYA-4762 TaxID=1051890 RepID=A0A3N4LK06_9PEZI|nr:hypothetical protein L211DRAFT_279841 [Terfezia boudieri ATCC MYA-4762]
MKRIHVQFEVVPANRTVEGFNWSPEKEGAQMDECLAWLRTNITLPEGTQFHSVANNSSFLNYTFGEGGSKYVLKGTTDVVILQNVYIRSRNILGGMQVIVELKKQVGDQDTRQVTLELISANVFSNYGVVVLLTDLNEYWHFLWLTKETRIEEIVLGLHCGVALLEDILHGRGSEEKPYCTRCNMEGIAAATTTTESVLQPTPVQNPMPGQRSTLLPLQRVDPFECVPKPEVGNMEDFFDEMTEFEVKKWKHKHVMDHISQAPGWD